MVALAFKAYDTTAHYNMTHANVDIFHAVTWRTDAPHSFGLLILFIFNNDLLMVLIVYQLTHDR